MKTDTSTTESGEQELYFVMSDSPPITNTFTQDEWEELTKDDQILIFFNRVNANALARSYWHEDFRRAFYDACHQEHARHCCMTYNNGYPFRIKSA